MSLWKKRTVSKRVITCRSGYLAVKLMGVLVSLHRTGSARCCSTSPVSPMSKNKTSEDSLFTLGRNITTSWLTVTVSDPIQLYLSPGRGGHDLLRPPDVGQTFGCEQDKGPNCSYVFCVQRFMKDGSRLCWLPEVSPALLPQLSMGS